VWLRQVNKPGPLLRQGNGFSVNGYLVVGPFTSTAAARRFVAHVREQHRPYDGQVDINLHNTGPRTYARASTASAPSRTSPPEAGTVGVS
jgi:hypothetical protein